MRAPWTDTSAKRLISDRVTEKIKPDPPILRDRQVQKSLLSQPVVVFGGMRCVAVVIGGPGREVGRQFQAAVRRRLCSAVISKSTLSKSGEFCHRLKLLAWRETGLSNR